MSTITAARAGEPIASRDDLVSYLEAGCKPQERWRIGTEHEKFPFHTDTLRPVAYDGPSGIGAFLEALVPFGWEPVFEGDKLIALKADDRGSISLEPGGQIELSGAPLENLHETCREVNDHLAQVKAVGRELGIGTLGVGFHPSCRRDEIPWMPKGRYKIMREYMPKVGSLGLDMMLRTCTVQTNLDFESEACMVRKFRVSLALQPVATALWANSPFTEGKPNGFLSYRSHIWTDTDPDRSGILPFVFEDGMGFERYVDYMLDVPMYFVYRDGRYVDASGQSFRDFLAGRLPALPGERPSLDDWTDHLTTAFPEVRLKRFLEMRGADTGDWGRICALPAFWVGLLYDRDCLQAAWDEVKAWTAEDHARLRADVPRLALDSPIRGERLRDVAKRVVAIARAGLRRRDRRNAMGDDETIFLTSVTRVAEEGRTPAQALLDQYHGPWKQSVEPLFREHAF